MKAFPLALLGLGRGLHHDLVVALYVGTICMVARAWRPFSRHFALSAWRSSGVVRRCGAVRAGK